jgi:hypothetical protein
MSMAPITGLSRLFASIRRRLAASALLTLTSAVLISVAAADAAAQPQITILDEEIVASGLSPGGEAFLLGISYEWQGWYTRISRRDQRLRADAGGNVRYNPEGGSQGRSAWAVVDLTSGGHAVSSSAPVGGRRTIVPPELIATVASQPDRFLSPGEVLETLLVQPGVGAWSWTGGDGGETDREPATGVIGFRTADLRPVAGSPPAPKAFPGGAILIVIESTTLDFYTVQLSR